MKPALLPLTFLPLLVGCSHAEERLARLEEKVNTLMQQQSEEQIIVKNLHLLQDYLSLHPPPPAPPYQPAVTNRYHDLKSWSKHTLDGVSSFFTNGLPGGD